jgi:hypothetical protein
MTGRARRQRAVGSRQCVVWDSVEAGAAHGIGATYLDVVVPASAQTRVGGLDTVEIVALDGDALQGRLVAP